MRKMRTEKKIGGTRGMWSELRSGELVKGVNVRRSEGEDGVWNAVGRPVRLREDSMVPVAEFDMPGTGLRGVLMQDGARVGVIVRDADGSGSETGVSGNLMELGDVDGEILAAYVVEPGVVRVLLRHSPAVYLTYAASGLVTMHGVMPALPPLRFEASSEVRLSETVTGCALKGATLSTASRLNPVDADAVGAQLLRAYDGLWEQATGLNMLLQPVLLRYRLEDAAGDTVASGPAVMACAAGGFQCTGEHELTADGALTVMSGGVMTGTAYNVALKGFRPLPWPWCRIVRRVVVESTLPIEPLRRETRGTTTMLRRQDGTVLVKARLGGVMASSVGMSTRLRSLCADTLADGLWLEQGSYEYPFSPDTAAERVLALRKDGVRQAQGTGSPTWRDAESYGACCVAGDLIVAADPLRDAENGFSPASMIATSADSVGEEWRIVVETKVASVGSAEEVAVAVASGTGLHVEGLSPMLMFPDERATSMTVTLELGTGTGRRVLSGTYGLWPLKGAGCACYVDGALRAFLPSEGGEAGRSPLSTRSRMVQHGVLLTGRMLTFDNSRCSARITDGPIHAVVEMPGGNTSWDFSRRRVLAGGAGGVHLVTLDATDSVHAVRLLTGRPVGNDGAICRASMPGGECVLTVAGGELVKVSGSRVETLASVGDAVCVGYDSRENEIWLGRADGSMVRVWRHKGEVEMSEVDYGTGACNRLLMWRGSLLLSCDNGLYDIRNASDGAYARFVLRVRYDTGSASAKIMGVAFNMFASHFKGRLTLGGDRGSRVAEEFVGLEAEGALDAPVAVAVGGMRRRYVELSAVGEEVSADAEWRVPSFWHCTQIK